MVEFREMSWARTILTTTKQADYPYIPINTRENADMTIAVGIPFKDGFVLAADQQISSPGWHKYHEPKIIQIDRFDWVVFLAYSGLPALAKEAHEKIVVRLSQTESSESRLTNDLIRNCAETVLTEMAQQHFHQLELSMLIVGSCFSPSFPELWMFNNSGFHSVFGEFQVLGVGDSSLIRYLQQMHSVHDSAEIAESLAIFLVEKAKQNIEGCGGPTNAVSVQSDAKHRWLYEDEVQERANKMNLREEDAPRSILLG